MKVNLFIFVFSLMICSIDGNFTVLQKTPINTMAVTNKQFSIQSKQRKTLRFRRYIPFVLFSFHLVDQPVNRPNTSSHIRFIVNSTRTVMNLDVINATVNITYVNMTLTFFISDPVPWNVSDQISICFDEGVFFSNATSKSSAQNSTDFWMLRVFDGSLIVTNVTTSFPQTTGGVETTASTGTTGYPVTSMMSTGQTNSVNTTVTTSSNLLIGESSPTRSAQWGMGLGITFISLVVIGEIIYFKYCYNDYGRSGSYYT